MKEIAVTTTVGELVAERPSRSRIFEQLGIDYCCGGNRSLQDACRDQDLDAGTVVQMLQAVEQSPANGDEIEWNERALSELVNHIESTHHAYLREALPRLEMLANRVASRHGEQYPWLYELYETFTDLSSGLEDHLIAEEVFVFPAILELACTPESSSYEKLDEMEDEHQEAGDLLTKLRQTANDYQPPEKACNSFKALLHGLEELEQDMHRHIHKENNILFPRARAAVLN